MRFRSLRTLALTTAFLLGACGSGSGAPGAPGTLGPSAQSLDGRTFLSTTVEGRTLVQGSTLRIAFSNGQVSANAGCNSMSGPYRIDGARLVVDELATTEMGCEPPLMDQDRWVADLLDGATVALDGDTLTLTNGVIHVVLLDREVADPDRPLLGTRWVVDGLISGDAVSSSPAGATAALTFSEGRLDLEAGCNTGGGTVRVTETTLEFGPIGLTKMACAPEVMALEQAVATVLTGTVGYTIEAATLTLDAGGIGLMLRAAP
jgi:heat shock protein HslJ